MGYSREGDMVVVRMTEYTFDGLLMCLGAAGAGSPEMLRISVMVANAVNAGRPLSEWRPYAVPDGKKERASGGTEYP
jgi:hypothetical protein